MKKKTSLGKAANEKERKKRGSDGEKEKSSRGDADKWGKVKEE